MSPYSVVIIKKINLLICYDVFLGNLWNVSEAVTGGVLWKKTVLKHFGIFTGKLQTWNFIKKRPQHGCFPLNIAKFLRTPIYKTSPIGCFWFFKTAKEHGWAVAFVLTQILYPQVMNNL